jgi:NADH:ubiquinone oxidoreductase subunit F (NADH-binding)
MSKNLRGLYARKRLKDNLFRDISAAGPALQEKDGKLLGDLAGKYLTGTSSVLAAGSFYDFLSPEHSSKKVFICDGTACLTSGRQKEVKNALIGKYREDEIGTVTCLGHCHTGNAYKAGNGIAYTGGPSVSDDENNSDPENSKPFNVGTNSRVPMLLEEIGDMEEFYGLLSSYSGNTLKALNEIELSGLRGRGGAGFPLHLKLKSSAAILSDSKYVVCNADEGDPGAFSDKWLLDNRTHSILFGMILTGMVIGADTGIFYVRGEYPDSVNRVRNAIDEFSRLKLELRDKDGNTLDFKFYLFEGQGAYICGEETSLLNSIEGLRPEVRTRPPFPSTSGLFGKPTILCNVETFANIHSILVMGGLAYSSVGTARSSGTKLVSLDSAFNRPGLYEVVLGTPLNEVFDDMGGGTKYPVKAFQVGGPLGGIVPAIKVNELTLDFESFADAGFLLGHAGVVSIPEDFLMIRFLSHLFEFTAKESCGKCFPCRIGSRQGAELLADAIENEIRIDGVLFSDLLDTMQLGSLCALGGGLSLPVRNALSYFSEELGRYFHPFVQIP